MINDNNYHPRPEAEGANTSALHIYIYIALKRYKEW